MNKIVIIFNRFGPYHHSRINALSKYFKVTGIEISNDDYTYNWDKVDKSRVFEQITLFDEKVCSKVSLISLVGRLTNTLKELKPDLLFIPGWYSRSSFIALLWATLHKLPSVIMSESSKFDKNRVQTIEFIKKGILSFYNGSLVGGSTHHKYFQSLGMSDDKIFTGYDVIDNAHFSRVNYSNMSEKLSFKNYFLASGRFIPKKNFIRLIEAYSKYYKINNIKAWDLVILGDGEMKEDIKNAIKDYGVSGKVHLPGFIQYDELPEFYGRSKCFIHPSTTEQWGLVVNEAMAAGLPVIVSNRCGSSFDLVIEGKNGYTFDPYNTKQIADTMHKISKLSVIRLQEMGYESINIIDNYSPDVFAKNCYKLAQKILN